MGSFFLLPSFQYLATQKYECVYIINAKYVVCVTLDNFFVYDKWSLHKMRKLFFLYKQSTYGRLRFIFLYFQQKKMYSKWVVSNDTKYVYFNHICRLCVGLLDYYCMFHVVGAFIIIIQLLPECSISSIISFHFFFRYLSNLYPFHHGILFEIRLLFLSS